MLNLTRLIHQRWSTSAPLTQLVPLERLFTGAAREPTMLPYAVLAVGGREPRQATSSGTTLHRATVEFRLWAEDLDMLDRLATAIAAAFDRIEVELEEGATLLDMRPSECSHVEQIDGKWHVRMTYGALVQT